MLLFAFNPKKMQVYLIQMSRWLISWPIVVLLSCLRCFHVCRCQRFHMQNKFKVSGPAARFTAGHLFCLKRSLKWSTIAEIQCRWDSKMSTFPVFHNLQNHCYYGSVAVRRRRVDEKPASLSAGLNQDKAARRCTKKTKTRCDAKI